MDKTKSIRGGIPILFPICGNLSTNNSVFGNGYLQLPQHGFARDLQWEYFYNENKKFLCLFLNASKKTKKYYPFDFEIKIEVTLKINCLEFEITIHNKTDFAMPINFGLHPYFNISDFKNLEFIDYPLNCQEQERNIISNTLDELNKINLGIDLDSFCRCLEDLLRKLQYKEVLNENDKPFLKPL